MSNAVDVASLRVPELTKMMRQFGLDPKEFESKQQMVDALKRAMMNEPDEVNMVSSLSMKAFEFLFNGDA